MRKFDQCAEIGLLQKFVRDPGKESRRGLTDGLRDFIRVDNHRALDVGAGNLKFENRKFRKEGRMLQSGKVLMS